MRPLQRFTQYILEHPYRLLMLTTFGTFIPVLGSMSIIIAAFITLVKSEVEGLVLTLACTLALAVSLYLPIAGTAPSLAFWLTLGIAVGSNLVTYVLAVMLARNTSFNTLLQITALGGVLIVSVVHLAYPDVVIWWGQHLQAYYDKQLQSLQNVAAAIQPGVDAATIDAVQEFISMLKHYLTGVAIAAALFSAFLQLIAARWWQMTVLKSSKLRHELCNIRLSPLAGILFIISMGLAIVENSVILDATPIIYMLFTAAGLSLVHFFLGLIKTSMSWFWLIFVYVMLILFWQITPFLLAMAGLFDIWIDLRKRVVVE